MITIRWTAEARTRLDDIEAHIALNSEAAAKDMIARLLARPDQLTIASASGREVPEYQRRDIRELLERPYRIIYGLAPERAVILTVMHYRQVLPRKADMKELLRLAMQDERP
jgi:toxin ParE1/3/4